LQLKYTPGTKTDLIEVFGDNEEPFSGINQQDYEYIEFPDAIGNLLVISAPSAVTAAMIALRYKNTFSAIAIAVPEEGKAIIVHTVSRDYRVGGAVPLAW
jgi:hypothetical protein